MKYYGHSQYAIFVLPHSQKIVEKTVTNTFKEILLVDISYYNSRFGEAQYLHMDKRAGNQVTGLGGSFRELTESLS